MEVIQHRLVVSGCSYLTLKVFSDKGRKRNASGHVCVPILNTGPFTERTDKGYLASFGVLVLEKALHR